MVTSGKKLSKTDRQVKEFNMQYSKLQDIVNFRTRNKNALKKANKKYYNGDISNSQISLLQLSYHYDKKESRLFNLGIDMPGLAHRNIIKKTREREIKKIEDEQRKIRLQKQYKQQKTIQKVSEKKPLNDENQNTDSQNTSTE